MMSVMSDWSRDVVTSFMFSIQTASTGPSNTSHFRSWSNHFGCEWQLKSSYLLLAFHLKTATIIFPERHKFNELNHCTFQILSANRLTENSRLLCLVPRKLPEEHSHDSINPFARDLFEASIEIPCGDGFGIQPGLRSRCQQENLVGWWSTKQDIQKSWHGTSWYILHFWMVTSKLH